MDLTPLHEDILKEFINIGMGRAAGIIQQMSGAHIRLHVPELTLRDTCPCVAETMTEQDAPLAVALLSFSGAFQGQAALVFPHRSADTLVNLLTDNTTQFMDQESLRAGTLQELGNIVLSGVLGALGNILGRHVQYLPPDFCEGTPELFADRVFARQGCALCIRTKFELEGTTVEGDTVIMFQQQGFAALFTSLDQIVSGMRR